MRMLHGGMITCRYPARPAFVAFSVRLVTPLVTKPMPLKSSQKRYLRGLAHALKPIIMVGGKGVSDALIAEFSIALDDHELVKVKLAGDDREQRAAQIGKLAEAAHAELVQSIGKTACFYRRNADKPRLALPK
jgi:RNA-binding protein